MGGAPAGSARSASVTVGTAGGRPTEPAVATAPTTPTTWTLVVRLWPLLAAMFVNQLPVNAGSIFVASIAADLASDVAVVGGARSLGGLAALLTGALAAPLIDRLPRAWSVPVGLIW